MPTFDQKTLIPVGMVISIVTMVWAGRGWYDGIQEEQRAQKVQIEWMRQATTKLLRDRGLTVPETPKTQPG